MFGRLTARERLPASLISRPNSSTSVGISSLPPATPRREATAPTPSVAQKIGNARARPIPYDDCEEEAGRPGKPEDLHGAYTVHQKENRPSGRTDLHFAVIAHPRPAPKSCSSAVTVSKMAPRPWSRQAPTPVTAIVVNSCLSSSAPYTSSSFGPWTRRCPSPSLSSCNLSFADDLWVLRPSPGSDAV
jgi:hypothetical protein